ncbi:MAG: hypothetical protein ACKN9T_06030, partial [Candidatus Methylumidiphilus sp.]
MSGSTIDCGLFLGQAQYAVCKPVDSLWIRCAKAPFRRVWRGFAASQAEFAPERARDGKNAENQQETRRVGAQKKSTGA